MHRRSAVAWLVLALAGLAWVVVCWRFPALRPASFPVFGLATLAVGWVIARWWNRAPLDYAAAAALIERDHPDLDQALRTAIEQQPAENGRYHFLQRRVIEQALQHGDTHAWDASRRHVKPWPALAHAAAVILVTCALALSVRPPQDVLAAITTPLPRVGAISVTPGNTEIERGSTVVIAARFEGDLPRSAALVWTTAEGGTRRTPMARSLSDPVYAFTLPRIQSDVDYHIEYEGEGSPVFRLQVFDRPALVRADADLNYPDYTGLADRRIEDTRRLTAVEGTEVDYHFMFNKPVRRAVLRDEDGAEIELAAANPERTRYTLDFTVSESVRYTLHLEDDAARANNAPPDIRIEALVNRRPDLKITFPRGDQRVSALEEIELSGEARDDFGLLDYGVAIAIGANPARYISLRNGSEPTDSARFVHNLWLEQEGVQPDDLVTWFAWADDAGADGQPRRTESDPFFGEVRPFDEIFREQAGGDGGQQSGGGGPQQELIELEREIAIGTWKLRQQNPPGENFADDIDVLVDAQAQAQSMLGEMVEMIRDPAVLAAATDAGRFMDEAHSELSRAAREGGVEPLAAAWAAARGAYQNLVRMQPPGTNVTRSRNGGGGAGRNQRQLSRLRMRNNEDNYESESQAQGLASPEERERLEMLGRLKDLARRQQDINDRLQEMQTALQAAETEEERERLRRELKRLEEEQRRMLANLDDVRQRLERQPPSSSARESREQLEQTRESMRQAGEALEEGDISQALAQGTRAQENLDQVSDELRKQSSSRFAEQLREARRAARELAEAQHETERRIEEFDIGGPRALDSSAEREAIAQRIAEQRAEHERLIEELRRVTEDSEVSEPGLHRQLYDLLRQHEQSGVEDRMDVGAELVRRGLLEQSGELQPDITRDLDNLRRGVERAAESVLGNELNTLRFAQNELDELTRELANERGAAGAGDEGEREAGDGREAAAAGSESLAGGDRPGAPPSPAGPDGISPPGQPGTGQAPGSRPDDPGIGESRSLAGSGQPPGPSDPTRPPQPGTGSSASRPDDPGTGASGVARGQDPAQPPSAGMRPGSQDPLTPGGGQQPGEQSPFASGNSGQPSSGARGAQPGEGEQSQLAQGAAPGEGETAGQAAGRQPGGENSAEAGANRPGQPGGDSGESLANAQQPGGQGGGAQGGARGGASDGDGRERGVASAGEPLGDGPRELGPGGGAGGDDELTRLLRDVYGGGNDGRGGGAFGPITGTSADYTDWEERLRTVEALLDSPEARARIAAARERAEQLRAAYRRHATPPQWGDVEHGIVAPLAEVRTWLRQEIARREDPTALQPVDRDPVPERFQENVRKYYEALGE